MANILKSESTPTLPQPSIPTGLAGFNLEDLAAQARQRLDDCQHQIASLRQQAEVEAKRIRQAAHQEGLKAGRAAAAAEADAKLRQAVERRVGEHAAAVQAMVQEIADVHQRWLQDYAETLVSLVVAICERVMRAKLQREPEIIARWTADALTAARSAQRLSVALHPETLAQLGATIDQLVRSPGLPEETTILADDSVPPDGVVVRQAGGEVVATLQSQLDRLRELLDDA